MKFEWREGRLRIFGSEMMMNQLGRELKKKSFYINPSTVITDRLNLFFYLGNRHRLGCLCQVPTQFTLAILSTIDPQIRCKSSDFDRVDGRHVEGHAVLCSQNQRLWRLMIIKLTQIWRKSVHPFHLRSEFEWSRLRCRPRRPRSPGGFPPNFSPSYLLPAVNLPACI